jgi:D-alanine-D-alanine ligase-like ATP-grasp enzyme
MEMDMYPDAATPDQVLVNAVQFYLRQVKHLEHFGLAIAEQPAWVEEALWDYACQAAERRDRWGREQAGRKRR